MCCQPDACLVTGILPETLQREGIPEVQAWEEILRQFTVQRPVLSAITATF